MGVAKILKLVGLYKVNEEYMKSVDEKLEAVEGDLTAIAEVADSGSQLVDALSAGDKAKAVEVALEFCKIDDEVKELKEIQDKVKAGQTIEAAVGAADAAALTKELVKSVMREVADHYEKITGLLSNLAAVGKEIADKLTNFASAAASWSLAEKIGTPEAVRNTGAKAKKILGAANEAKTKLGALKDSIAKIKK